MDCSCFGFVNPNHKEIIFNGMYVLVEGSCQAGMEFFLNVSRNLFLMFQWQLCFRRISNSQRIKPEQWFYVGKLLLYNH